MVVGPAVTPARAELRMYRYTIKNTTGQVANDLHVSVEDLGEDPTADASGFNEAALDEIANTIDFSVGAVAPGGASFMTWLGLFPPDDPIGQAVKTATWTQDGSSIGDGAFAPMSLEIAHLAGGWEVTIENQHDAAVLFFVVSLFINDDLSLFTPVDFLSPTAMSTGTNLLADGIGFTEDGELAPGERMVLGVIPETFAAAVAPSATAAAAGLVSPGYVAGEMVVVEQSGLNDLGQVGMGAVIPPPIPPVPATSNRWMAVLGLLLAAGAAAVAIRRPRLGRA
jgi:hypothetical protein